MRPDAVKVLITGDFCPINRVEIMALNKNFGAIYNDFIDVFRNNDLNITDLECPLTKSKSARKKYGPHQKAHPDCIEVLKYADLRLVAMANNHIMDYAEGGVRDTIELCRINEIETVGIGGNLEEAAKPYFKSIKGKKIAVLNCADNEFISTPDGSFTCNPINPVRLYYDIAAAKAGHDYVIVIIHAGNEYYELPSPRTKRLYRYIIDQGADAIISHHTHAFSGYEIYKSRPIFYGLGNFIYDWPGKVYSSWNKGYVVRLILSEKIDFEVIPLKQANEKPGVFHLNTEENEDFCSRIALLNEIIGDDKRLETEFQKYCNSIFPMYEAFLEPNFGRYIGYLRQRGMFPKFLSRRKQLLLLNLSRCESHLDVLLRLLSRYE